MALLDTVVFVVDNSDTSLIRVFSKDLQTELYNFDQVIAVSSMHFDQDRKKLWTADTSSNIRRYDISDTTEILEDTIDTGTIDVQSLDSMTVDRGTGHLYLSELTVDQTKTVKKILLTSSGTVDATLVLDPTVGVEPIINSPLVINEAENRGYLIYGTGYDVAGQNNISESARTFSLDLLTEEIGYDIHYQANGNSAYSPLGNKSGQSINLGGKYCGYNPITQKVQVHFNQIAHMTTYHDLLIAFTNKSYDDVKKFYFSKYSDASSLRVVNVESITGMFIGRNSGSTYVLSDERVTKFSSSGNEEYTKVLPSMETILTAGGWAFNEITEDFYMTRYVAQDIIMFNKDGNIVQSTQLTGYPRYLLTGLGTNENNATSSQTSSPVVTFPVDESSTTDDTPDIIFRIGQNEVNWTQQFRVVADTDLAVIQSSDPLGTYERNFDSWLNGSNYLDCTWTYSTDHDTTDTGNPLNGTWSTLGTSDGVQSGGATPTNGVNSQMDTGTDVYIRLTIPAAGALTGAASNTPWYFNVFSYSKYV